MGRSSAVMREMFAGEYACKLDDKGRFSVPTSLREPFSLSESSDAKRAMLVKSQQERCLWLLPVPHWRALLEFQQERLSERESRLFMHHVVYDVVEVEMDRANRLLVPRRLREHIGANDNVVLVGMYDHLEVWGSQAWSSHLAALEEEHETTLSDVLRMPSFKPALSGA
jgi:MraZ protein